MLFERRHSFAAALLVGIGCFASVQNVNADVPEHSDLFEFPAERAVDDGALMCSAGSFGLAASASDETSDLMALTTKQQCIDAC